MAWSIAASFAVTTGAFSAAHKAAVFNTAKLGGHKFFTNAKGMMDGKYSAITRKQGSLQWAYRD